MKTFEYEYRYLKAGVGSLENYLLSNDTFWPMDTRPPKGEPEYPELTLGGLLLSRTKLSAYAKSADQMRQFADLSSEMDKIRAQWRVAWEKKATHGFSLRLRMWRDFVEDYRHAPQDNADRYPYEVRLRAMVSLLKSEGGGKLPAEADLLQVLDKFLKASLVTDEFIWEPELQPGFPTSTFWYLYGRLPSMPLKD